MLLELSAITSDLARIAAGLANLTTRVDRLTRRLADRPLTTN